MKILARNRKAWHEYTVLEKFEAGIELRGTEVKVLKDARCNFVDSYAWVDKGELQLHSLDIPVYEKGNVNNHEPKRRRRLLMHKHEIAKLKARIEVKGLTLIPLSVYLNDKGFVKIELGLCRGKTLYDKRESLARKEAVRSIRSLL